MKTYLVGGAVRDQLLGLPVTEKDYVVVGTTPEHMHKQGYKPVGKDFPVFLHPESKEEYALARTERKTGKGYTEFVFYADPSVTLEEDLQRRDLTINAMALDEHNHLIDPYHGKQDLEKRLLRHVSPAFVEDPVRVLRIARFAARFAHLGFTIAPETQQLLRAIVRAGEIDALVPERVWQEWQKALAEPDPQIFIEVLRNCGAFAILMPEVDKLFGVPGRPEYHPEIDTGVHTLMAMKYAAQHFASPLVCFAANLHDLGKAKTPAEEWPSHRGHEEAGKSAVLILCKRYKVPREYTDLALLTSEYHLHVHRALELKPATMLKLFEQLDAFRRPRRFEFFLQACAADFFGRKNFDKKTYPQIEFLHESFLKMQNIKMPDFSQGTLSGDQIKEKIRRLRLQALAMKWQ